ncbi:diaminopropionate ammonia-lyase [Streptomyces albiaxialis]
MSPLSVPHWYVCPSARFWNCPPAPDGARAFHASLPGYAPTPLTELPALARGLGVGRLFAKDESARLGLPAFKALGATWAVHRLLEEHAGGGPVTLVTATDGNHGRAVARTARLRGQRAHVFVSRGVHPAAVAAVAGEGARVTTVDGPYDEAVRAARAAAGAPGTLLVQDSGQPGYERVPGWIVEGYATLFAETDEQLARAGAAPPDLVAVPAGVGSLAQAAVVHYRSPREGRRPPVLLTAEPEAAPCVLTSLRHGEPRTVPTGETAMAGLNCGTPSLLAWPYLRDGIDAAVAVDDAAGAAAARDLAAHGVPAGPCGAAPLAGLRAALGAAARPGLDLAPDATVVLLSTEGAEANPGYSPA